MILTYRLKHNRDFKKELELAFLIAEHVVKNNITSSNSALVKDIRGSLPSMIACQIMRKYGRQKNIKKVHNVTLTIPKEGILYLEESNSIWVGCLKLQMEDVIPINFIRISHIEIDKEFANVSVIVPHRLCKPQEQLIGIDRNTTGHVAVTANPDTGKIGKFGKSAMHIHRKYSVMRKRLQKEGKFRELKRVKDREHRIVKDINHKISRKIVDMAKEQHAALVFEDLYGIRKTRKQNRSFKYALNSWSFYQLQTFVEYKAKLLGIPVLYVDPAFTSQDCSRCGTRGQRKGKEFKCPICGHVDHADVNAAFNIALRQKSMVDRMQKEMCTMGALIPHDALLECEATSEPYCLSELFPENQ